jgi:hypothetical protein
MADQQTDDNNNQPTPTPVLSPSTATAIREIKRRLEDDK